MAEEKQDLTVLWNEVLDCMDELKGDLKDNIRAHRHLKNLQQKVAELGDAMLSIAKGSKHGRFLH